MVMVDSVEGVQLICCVLAWDLILPSIETTQIIEAVVVARMSWMLSIPSNAPE